MRQIDFQALFGLLPSPHIVLDRKLRYVEANDAYLRMVERRRDELIGHGVFEVFPNDDDGARLLRASLDRVLGTKQPDPIALLPYPIARRNRGGELEMRYWSAINTPLLDDEGEVAFVIQNVVDVTELQRLKEIAYGRGGGDASTGENHLLQRAQELHRTNLSLLKETAQLRDLFMQAPGFMAVLSGPELTFALVNRAFQQLIGDRVVVGHPLSQALPEVIGQAVSGRIGRVMADQEPFLGRAVSVRLQRATGAPLEERFVDFVLQPILNADGKAWGVFVEGSDVTDRVRAEAQQKLLVEELNHRVKNTLATVQSIAAQTLRTSATPEDFRQAFEARLLALSETHDLLTAASWRGADLRDLVARELRPHGPERYHLEGPDLALSPSQALALCLLFHELATNAAKYGALSSPDGCVRVRWSVDDQAAPPRLSIAWTEELGPKVTPPTREGFGSRLIERSLQGELGGEASLEFREDGLHCTIGLPLGDGVRT